MFCSYKSDLHCTNETIFQLKCDFWLLCQASNSFYSDVRHKNLHPDHQKKVGSDFSNHDRSTEHLLSHLDWVCLLNVISAGICPDHRTVQRSRPCPASTQLLHPVVCSSGRSPVDQVEGKELEPKLETSGHSSTERVVPWHRSSSGYQNQPTGFLWRHRPHSEPWSSELMSPPGRSRSGEENKYCSLILMVSEKPAENQVSVHLVVRPGTNLLGVGSGTGGTTCRSPRFRCCRGQRKGASMNGKAQQHLPCWSASFYPGSDDRILIGQKE